MAPDPHICALCASRGKTCCTLVVQRAEVLDYLVCRSSCPVGHAVLTDNKLPQKQFIKVT